MKYKTIVIDPPWNTETGTFKTSHGHMNARPYKSMKDDEILNFNINEYADDNCDLFLWTTNSKIDICFDILKKWGFKYHCMMVWDKRNGVNICGFQRSGEFVLYAYKGKMGVIRKSKYIPVVFQGKRKNHSRKPDEFFDLITPKTQEPRISIFEREKREGFDIWGDEAPE